MSNVGFIITVDGPAGTGKTTVSEMIADHYGFFHLKGGTFLRSFTRYVINEQINYRDEKAIGDAIAHFQLSLIPQKNVNRYDIWVNGVDVTASLWTPAVDEIVSIVSSYPKVRETRKTWLRTQAGQMNLVADGRTLGTEIFPDASVKFYLDAKLEIRAQRRWTQLGKPTNGYQSILESIAKRDTLDTQGYINRLAIGEGLIYLDTSKMDLLGLFKLMQEHINLKWEEAA